MSEKETKKESKLQMSSTNKLMLAGFILVLLGILATYIPWKVEPTSANVEPFVKDVEANTEILEEDLTYEEFLEMRLESILVKLEGAGATDVMVTVSAGQEKILAEEVVEVIQDTNELTETGFNRNTTSQDVQRTIVMQEGDTPFVVKENRPEIEGVLVLAEGADNISTKNAIIQAVSSVLDVPVHKIAVYKMAQN